jgi:cytoskeletal protein CcmA (bactofilin family)
VKDTLALKDGSNITGNLHIRRLHVELGATFNGSCKTITESEFDKLTGTAAPAKAQQPAVQPQHQNPAQAHAN